jgi:rare lipoprotein A
MRGAYLSRRLPSDLQQSPCRIQSSNMQYKRLGNAVAVILASVVGWSVSPSIKPIQAETVTEAQSALASNVSASESHSNEPKAAASTDVAKVGEAASQQNKTAVEKEVPAIAKVFAHIADGRQAATVYVRNIPVLTYLGDAAKADSLDQDPTELRKLATSKASPADESQPLWKANKLAAELNQLNRKGKVKGEDISVRWKDDLYLIENGGSVLATLDKSAMLPDSTGAAAEDALQATNRLRRLLGQEGASPLTAVADLPTPPKSAPQVVASRGGAFYQQGEASWYGPGFHGRTSASGETFNQWAMTAAHKNLPFGTLVRVTNLNNGTSVDVRINDRGPYAHGRVIDLSAAAANSLRMDGVAYVRIDVLK